MICSGCSLSTKGFWKPFVESKDKAWLVVLPFDRIKQGLTIGRAYLLTESLCVRAMLSMLEWQVCRVANSRVKEKVREGDRVEQHFTFGGATEQPFPTCLDEVTLVTAV